MIIIIKQKMTSVKEKENDATLCVAEVVNDDDEFLTDDYKKLIVLQAQKKDIFS